MIDFQTQPEQYRHWRLSFDGPVAFLTMDVDENGGLVEGYELKMNSYDLGVDIELYDAVQRLRFEHPEVGAVVIDSNKERIFCAGANIRMLGQSAHAHKVNFCKFTNETRNSIEDASDFSGQRFISAINGTAAGGGYELALATDHIMLVDDGSAAVSLPEVPLLAVLPGTGGLTRLVDKRKVRRDLADVFCTLEEGVRGRRAVEWRLVDETVPNSRFVETVKTRAAELAAGSDRPAGESGIVLTPLDRKLSDGRVDYSHIGVMLDPQLRVATITLKGPADGVPESIEQIKQQGAAFWPLTLVRELDDALLHLRTNESETCTLVFKTRGEVEAVAAYERILQSNAADWFVREIILYWKRTFKRIDMTSRSTLTLVDQGSCFSGLLAELVFAADRAYMLEGKLEDDERPEAALQLSAFNFGLLPMSNGLTRLQTRFLGEPESLGSASRNMGESLDAVAALDAGLVTFAPDDIDWQDEIRLLLEERASFSPDALTGMEVNLRFAGPETMETKIFGRLTAWQNWIFQRPNAVSDGGALRLYGSGVRPEFNKQRV